jgi:hypothetical protein
MEAYLRQMNQQTEAMRTRILEFIATIKDRLPQGCKFEDYSGGASVLICLPQIPGHDDVKQISVSAIKIMERKDLTTKVLETALFGKNGLIYVEELDYYDVIVHDNDEEVLAEIVRLIEYTPDA